MRVARLIGATYTSADVFHRLRSTDGLFYRPLKHLRRLPYEFATAVLWLYRWAHTPTLGPYLTALRSWVTLGYQRISSYILLMPLIIHGKTYIRLRRYPHDG